MLRFGYVGACDTVEFQKNVVCMTSDMEYLKLVSNRVAFI